jgi:hypothetical protein
MEAQRAVGVADEDAVEDERVEVDMASQSLPARPARRRACLHRLRAPVDLAVRRPPRPPMARASCRSRRERAE